MEIKKIADRLLYLCDTIPPMIRQQPEAAFSEKAAPGKWSRKEILGHLIDSATNNHHRFVRTTTENAPAVAYDGDKWVNAQQYQQMDREQLLLFWESYNRHLAAIIGKIKKEDLLKTCKVTNGALLPLQFLITDYLTHLEHHLRQLVEY